VPVIGYGVLWLRPLGAPFDREREIVTSAFLVLGLAATMARGVVKRRALRHADGQIRLLAAACEQSEELIVIVRRAEVHYANDAFCRATGYSRGEAEGLPASRFLPPDSADLVAAAGRALEARHPTRVTTTIVRKDGSTFSAACAFAPIVDLHRGVTHVVGTVRDLSDEIHLREELVRAERMAAIGDLVSSVSHELGNSLQSILGTLDVLTAIRPEAEMGTDLDQAVNQADHAATIVKNLLVFIRRSTGQRVLGDLSEMARAAVAARAQALRTANIDLLEAYAPDLPLVLANPEELHQAITNLVVNAQESMSVNGRGTLRVVTRVSDAGALLEVTDDGPRVPADLAGRVFEPLAHAAAAGGRGGLGLSVSFGIVAAHGGSLELVEPWSAGESVSDPRPPGACVRVVLPGAGFAGPPIAR